jgi:uncharacterized protein YbbK (DUF523 family)
VARSLDGRPRIGISRCLLGDEVRYDGGHRRDAWLVETLGALVDWVPVCPEVETGMGTPREPIHLVAAPEGLPSGSHQVRLLGVSSGRDWTSAFGQWAATRVRDLAAAELSGFVLKAGSPSCGIDHVPIAGVAAEGRGLFAQALLDACPDLPIEDERRLVDPAIREAFLARVFARHRVRRAESRA